MPEQPPSKPALHPWTLSKAHGVGQLVRVCCGHCNITRHYQPADLQRLAGDITAAVVRMRCERCKKTEWMRVTFESLSAGERQTIRVRRLTGVKIRRIPVWRDVSVAHHGTSHQRPSRSPWEPAGQDAKQALPLRFAHRFVDYRLHCSTTHGPRLAGTPRWPCSVDRVSPDRNVRCRS